MAEPRVRFAMCASAALAAALSGGPARADAPARVRVLFHQRGRTAAVTYLDISVEGTEVPIRLVRRMPGACTRELGAASGVLVRVTCGAPQAPTVYEVAREGGAIVVRRTPPLPDGAAGAATQLVTRATLPPRTDVRVVE